MGCCGQARAAYVPELRPAAAPAPRAPDAPAVGDAAGDAGAAPAPATVRLHFVREMGVRVRGPVSGLSYAFSGDAPVQAVDARDAEGLLHTGYFRRAV
ncbi:MAG TPA: hypothetical protein VFR37_06060 [Longimicrobium sp.]|nr:hypothetical protein [Longimicrobium sp.]